MRETIIIPTYSRSIEEGHTQLSRLLESIHALGEKGLGIIILNNTIDRGKSKEITKKIREIVKPYGESYSMGIVGYPELDKLHEFFRSIGYEDLTEHINFKPYSNFRNLGLLVAEILGSEVIILLDDDMVIEDPEYLKKAREFIGKKYKGERVYGIGGHYLNRQGSYLIPEERLVREWWNIGWRKLECINQVLHKIHESKERIIEAPVIFCGNLVLHRELFGRIPFDPYISRGEDIDLLINARLFGYKILLDNERGIRHVHYHRTPGDISLEILRDTYRFAYERKKILRKDPSLLKFLDPYPGRFLGRGIYLKAAMTSFLLFINYLLRGRIKECSHPIRTLIASVMDARIYAERNCRKYFDFQRKWEITMGKVYKEKHLRDYFKERFGWR